MSASMNRVMLMGNLGRDPELMFADTENPCLKLSLATNEVWRDKNDQKQQRTEWHNVELRGPRARLLSGMLSKGMRVWIDGSIRTKTVDGPAGVKRRFTDIHARDLMILDWQNEARQRNGGDATGGGAAASAAM